ncbi:MAG: ATP-grasp domain-containing protein [Prevotella sp.]|nr:ATP-grasp domain-containing protein [Prevotella sp.]
MVQKVVIVGIGYTSRLGLIRAVAEIGCEVVVVTLENHNKRPIDTYSKYVSEVIHFPQRNGNEALVRMLMVRCKLEEGKAILIPNSDWAVAAIDNHHDLLKEHFHLPHVGDRQGALVEWMDKERQKDLAQKLGMEVAQAVNIEITDGEYKLPTGINYPCFTKTRAYTPGYKSTLHRCDNEGELCQALNQMARRLRNLTIMVEDYKEIDTEYAVVGFSDGRQVVIPGVIEMLRMTEKGDKGVAIQGKISPSGHLQLLLNQFVSLVREIGLTGLFDIDFYLCNGKYYFDELNLRVGGSATAVMKTGVNLPAMLVKTTFGEPITDMSTQVSHTATFVNERTCTDSWDEGCLTTQEYLHILRTSDIRFLDDYNDPMPAKVFQNRQRIKRIKHIIKQILPWKKT